MQRGSAAVNRDAIPNAHVCRPLLREPLGLDALLFGNLFGGKHLGDGGSIGIGDLRPRLNEPMGNSPRASVDSEFILHGVLFLACPLRLLTLRHGEGQALALR